jgi:excisionase family DNA binding protein
MVVLGIIPILVVAILVVIMEKLFSQKEVATYLQVHIQTVKTWYKEGLFPNAFKVGTLIRIPESDIEALKTQKKAKA